jgi:hypothetical protein
LLDERSRSVQDAAKQREAVDMALYQSTTCENAAMDFCPAMAKIVLGETAQTVGLVSNGANQICVLVDLPHQESYQDMQPHLHALHKRQVHLQGQASFLPATAELLIIIYVYSPFSPGYIEIRTLLDNLHNTMYSSVSRIFLDQYYIVRHSSGGRPRYKHTRKRKT